VQTNLYEKVLERNKNTNSAVRTTAKCECRQPPAPVKADLTGWYFGTYRGGV